MLDMDPRRCDVIRLVLLLAFAGTVWLANWMLTEFGTWPVTPWHDAPAGVFAAGLAFSLRDLLHERAGRWWVLVGIVLGATVAYVVSDAVQLPGGVVSLAVASAAAFGFSELADFAVYDRIRQQSRLKAMAVSNLVGAPIDSALFLWLAFGAFDHLPGQVIGKLLMVMPAAAAMWWWRHR
jgi:queuosine precursor transporter